MTKRYSNEPKAEFVKVEVVDSALAKRLDGLMEARKKARDLQDQFETQFIAAARKKGMLDEGYTLAFGYKFGGLAVAKVPEKSAETRTSGKPVIKF